MESSTKSTSQGAFILVAIVAALAALIVACVAWAMLGYLLAWKLGLAIGSYLPPVASGCLGGLVMRFGRKGLHRKTGWIAAVVTLTGCIVGDVIWIMLVQQKSLSTLFGTELTATMNTLTSLTKIVMFAVACYLSYIISNPPKTFVSN